MYEANITILDSTENSYTVQWIFNLPAKLKEANPELQHSLPVFNGMKMIFKTSETGIFQELINWEEVKDAYIKMMEVSLPKIVDSTARINLEQTKSMFNSREMVESVLIKEIQLFYLPFGYSFTRKKIDGMIELPNPFGGEPLPASVTYQVTELNTFKDYFVLAINQDIVKLDALKIFKDFFRKSDLDNEKAIIEAEKIMKTFEMADYSEYKFNSSIGLPEKIKYVRTIKNNQLTNTDSYIIEMKQEVNSKP